MLFSIVELSESDINQSYSVLERGVLRFRRNLYEQFLRGSLQQVFLRDCAGGGPGCSPGGTDLCGAQGTATVSRYGPTKQEIPNLRYVRQVRHRAREIDKRQRQNGQSRQKQCAPEHNRQTSRLASA